MTALHISVRGGFHLAVGNGTWCHRSNDGQRMSHLMEHSFMKSSRIMDVAMTSYKY